MTHSRAYESLKRYVAALSDEERIAQLSKCDTPVKLKQLVLGADTVALECARQADREFGSIDENGLTPLHHAAARDSDLVTEILTETPNRSVWTRDAFARLPIDIAQQTGALSVYKRLEALTYPVQFSEVTENPRDRNQFERYADLKRKLNSPETAPSIWSLRSMPADEIQPRSDDRSDRTL